MDEVQTGTTRMRVFLKGKEPNRYGSICRINARSFPGSPEENDSGPCET